MEQSVPESLRGGALLAQELALFEVRRAQFAGEDSGRMRYRP